MASEMTSRPPATKASRAPSSFPSLPSFTSAELHAQIAPLLSRWERPGEGACISAKHPLSSWERAGVRVRSLANLRGLGYGG